MKQARLINEKKEKLESTTKLDNPPAVSPGRSSAVSPGRNPSTSAYLHQDLNDISVQKFKKVTQKSVLKNEILLESQTDNKAYETECTSVKKRFRES